METNGLDDLGRNLAKIEVTISSLVSSAFSEREPRPARGLLFLMLG
jgi:hypothetical protein